LQAGKGIEEARIGCEHNVHAVAASRNDRWVSTAGGLIGRNGTLARELKACEVKTRIVKHSKVIRNGSHLSASPRTASYWRVGHGMAQHRFETSKQGMSES